MKKRKVILWRLALVIFTGLILIGSVSFGTYKVIKFVLNEQAKNREKLVVHVVTEVYEYDINIYDLLEIGVIEDNERSDSIDNNVCDCSSSNDSEELVYIGEFRLTGYCDCEECQEQWVGTTALGVAPTEEKTIAVDPKIIPLGSTVYIEGLGYRVAEDVGGMINDYDIDVFVGSHSECFDKSCNRQAKVYIVEEAN